MGTSGNIETYLSDHLAGATMALELLEHLRDSDRYTELRNFFRELHAEIEADQQELQRLMTQLQASESRTRKATAWIAEKFTELKLHFDDPGEGDLRLFESLEVLSLGIEGKLSLWLALAAAQENTPELRVVDYQKMAQRARTQREQVEAVRINVARRALAVEDSSSGFSVGG